MATARAQVRFKADDIWDTPDDGNRYEVIDGVLYVTPAPSWQHQYGSGRLYLYLGQFIFAHRLGAVVTAPTGVVLDEYSGVQPDLVYVSNARAHLISERGVEGAPDLVVEVLSPRTRKADLGVKMRRYAAAGIPHYWVLDVGLRRLDTYVQGKEGYELTGSYGPGEIFRPALFPGLEIPVDDLWTT